MNRSLSLNLPHGRLHGELELPETIGALVLMARARPYTPDGLLAGALLARHYAVLHFPLLSAQEAQFPDAGHNIPKLTERLLDILRLIRREGDLQELPLALYAVGDATPPALRAAARRDNQVASIACHGGLCDRAGIESLEMLTAPLLVLTDPEAAIERQAFEHTRPHLHGEHRLETIGTTEHSVLVADWFARTLGR